MLPLCDSVFSVVKDFDFLGGQKTLTTEDTGNTEAAVNLPTPQSISDNLRYRHLS